MNERLNVLLQILELGRRQSLKYAVRIHHVELRVRDLIVQGIARRVDDPKHDCKPVNRLRPPFFHSDLSLLFGLLQHEDILLSNPFPRLLVLLKLVESHLVAYVPRLL